MARKMNSNKLATLLTCSISVVCFCRLRLGSPLFTRFLSQVLLRNLRKAMSGIGLVRTLFVGNALSWRFPVGLSPLWHRYSSSVNYSFYVIIARPLKGGKGQQCAIEQLELTLYSLRKGSKKAVEAIRFHFNYYFLVDVTNLLQRMKASKVPRGGNGYLRLRRL